MNKNKLDFIIKNIVDVCNRGLTLNQTKEYVLNGEFTGDDYWYIVTNEFSGIIVQKLKELGVSSSIEVRLNDVEKVFKFKVSVWR